MKRLIPSWNIFLTDEEWESYADSLIIEEKSLINEDSGYSIACFILCLSQLTEWMP
ncbi:MAG: hypothetical protein ACOX4X_09990 [Aminobacterium colombiense]|uniref:hypothetical protein n=1 Tax=Aminobacterium colombiense TaxID=81468 RepID=UPI003D96FDFE